VKKTEREKDGESKRERKNKERGRKAEGLKLDIWGKFVYPQALPSA
jgi:hypothetical protein